jgi:VWFA-related protein
VGQPILAAAAFQAVFRYSAHASSLSLDLMLDSMRQLAALAAGACIVAAQQAPDEVRVSAHVYTPPQLRLTAQAQLVQLEVVVRDAHGQPVSGLKQADFEILDEGKPRAIAAFSVETRGHAPAPEAAATPAPSTTASMGAPPAVPPPAPPRSTLLFFDDQHATGGELQRTQAAAKRFVQDGLGPGARAAVYAASEGLTLDFTADADAIAAAIDKLRTHQRVSENGLQPCPRITPYQAYLIVNNLDYTALNAAIAEANQCRNATVGAGVTSSIPKGPRMIPTSPTAIAVRAQAEATWQMAREISLTSFDAIDNAMALLAKAPGSRVLLMVSTGFLSGMLDAVRDAAIDRAIHAGIVINALDAKGLWSEGVGRAFGQDAQTYKGFPIQTFIFEATSVGSRNDALNAVMEEFAAGTGGLFFHNNNDLVGGFAQLAAVPETAYLLAFRPDEQGAAGKYHKLKVRLTPGTHDYVQARPGYFAPANPPAEAKTELRKLDQEAIAADTLAEIPVQLTGSLSKTEKGAPVLSLLIHVDLAKLKFTESSGRQTQKLAFIGALMDANGNLVTAKEGAMELALKPETLARMQASGVNAALTLSAPPGPYRVRIVVQDAEGKLAALSQAVALP